MLPSGHRRDFLRTVLAASGLAALPSRPLAANDQVAAPVPVRAITRGPRHHWFGYYDKLQFDPAMRYVLGMEVDFEHRSPRPDDVLRLGMVDLQDGDRWIELGTSRAWCWQQGCMLQWLPGSSSHVLWNDREGDEHVCRILDVASGVRRTVGRAVYALSPDGRTAVSTDFRRINDVRPGYGYAGLPDPYSDQLAPRDSGIWRVDLTTGHSDLIISIAQIASLGRVPQGSSDVKHYFNHLLFSPDGTRFVFLHRWRYPNGKRLTRMLTAGVDGSDVRVIDDNGLTSHFIWRDPQHLLAWSGKLPQGNALCLFEDREGGTVQAVGPGVLTWDGHVTYRGGRDWILTDTYPDSERLQTVYLYHVPAHRLVRLGAFRSPAEYTGEWRCDTHPRSSPDGRWAVIDSPHGESGRQMYLLDLSGVT